MEIYDRLPSDIQRKMFQYFRHPIAQQLHNYPWVIPQIINQWPPPPTTADRIAMARLVMQSHPRQRCGCCRYYEQHQVCCNYLLEEELDTWDPVIKATPIQQAIQKCNLLENIEAAANRRWFGRPFILNNSSKIPQNP